MAGCREGLEIFYEWLGWVELYFGWVELGDYFCW